MTAAVPDPRFRDQLVREVSQYDIRGVHPAHIVDRIEARIAAEVEARVQAAANQRAAEELEAAAQWLNADPDKGGAPYITNDHTVLFPDKLEIAQAVSWACASLRDRAAALASPAPAPRAEEA